MGFHVRAIVSGYYRDMKRRRMEREQRVSYGSAHADKTFYVVRRNYGYIGLFSIYVTHLGRIRYALENGWIPVVDMQNYPNVYLEEENLGKQNAWEFFFTQPSAYTMEDVAKAKNVILGDMGIPDVRPTDDTEMFTNEGGVLDPWREIAGKYACINEELRRLAEEDRERLFGEKERVLGVSLRGTDYTKTQPAKHPVQPTAEQAMERVEALIHEKHYDRIYLSTEDIGIAHAFTGRFGDMVKTFDKEYIAYKGGTINDVSNTPKGERRLRGEEYLREKLLLTCCRDVAISRTSGTLAMSCLSPDWENVFVFDYGRYPG